MQIQSGVLYKSLQIQVFDGNEKIEKEEIYQELGHRTDEAQRQKRVCGYKMLNEKYLTNMFIMLTTQELYNPPGKRHKIPVDSRRSTRDP